MDPHMLEILFTFLERHYPDATIVYSPGLNKRVGLENAPLLEVFKKAHDMHLSSIDLVAIPEQDSWLYATKQNGKPVKSRAMVCVDFACQVLKAAGVFGNLDFNCNELNLVDLHKLKIFDENHKRP